MSERLGSASLSFGPFQLFPAERRLLKGNTPVEMGSRALDILIVLTERPGEVVTHRDLIARVWPSVIVEDANLRVHVSGLRKALGDGEQGARFITNVPGRGYSFVAAVAAGTQPPPSRPDSDPDRSGPASRRAVKLPHRLDRMVGRDDAVTGVSSLLLERRFVSIVAPGGMGKTTVAITVAHSLLDRFDGAVFFVDLAELTQASLVVDAISAALGVTTALDDQAGSLIAFIAEARLMLILDNCEHVVEEVALLAERLHRDVPGLHLLTTSRETLRVEGEHVYLLKPLVTPMEDVELTARQALESPAVRLFMDRSAASGHDASLSDAEAPVVASICRRLDGIALAIELVASRVGALGIQGTAALLDDKFRVLWHGRRSALPRHKTLRAMLDWSYDLLTPQESSVIARLSVFVGSIRPESAQAVAGEEAQQGGIAETLQGLVEKSLLWSDESSGVLTYRLAETTRAYLLIRLEERGEATSIARRHASHMTALIAGSGTDDDDADDVARTLQEQLGNIRAALEWSFSGDGDSTIATGLAANATGLMLSLSLHSEARRWSARALSALTDADRGTNLELSLQQTLATSTMFALGNGPAVRAAIERGLEIAEALGAHRQRLHLLSGLHIYFTRLGSFSDALDVAGRNLAIAREHGSPEAQVIADWMTGVSYHLTGNQALAQRHAEAGFMRADRLGHARLDFFGYDHRIRALITFARTLWLRGDAERAVTTGKGAIEEANRRGHPVSLCIAMIYTSTVLLWNDDIGEAAPLVERLLAHAGRHRLGPYHAVGLALQGEIRARRGDLAEGIEMMQTSLTALQAEQHLVLASGTARALAEALARSGNSTDAVRLLDEVIARIRAREGKHSVDLPDLLRARANVELARPYPDRALAEGMFLSALAAAREQTARAWELRAAVALAAFWYDHEQAGRARDLLRALLAEFGGQVRTCDLPVAQNLLERQAQPAA